MEKKWVTDHHWGFVFEKSAPTQDERLAECILNYRGEISRNLIATWPNQHGRQLTFVKAKNCSAAVTDKTIGQVNQMVQGGRQIIVRQMEIRLQGMLFSHELFAQLACTKSDCFGQDDALPIRLPGWMCSCLTAGHGGR